MPWPDLPAVGVAGKLQGNAFIRGNGKIRRAMREQDAGAASIQVRALQQRFEKSRIVCRSIVDTHDLQPIDFHLFVVQNADTGALHRIHELCAVIEFFEIASALDPQFEPILETIIENTGHHPPDWLALLVKAGL